MTSTYPDPGPAADHTSDPVSARPLDTPPQRPLGALGARKAYLAVCVLLALAVLLQFYFAAFGVFTEPENDSQFALHSIDGTMVIPALSLIACIVAAIAKAPGRTIALSILPLLLIVVQILLFMLAGATGATEHNTGLAGSIILGFHAVNGLAVLATAGVLVQRARRLVNATSTPAAPVGA